MRIFENKLLSIMFGLKREEGTGGWRKLRNEELHNPNSSPDIIWVVKSRSSNLRVGRKADDLPL
jgi:hypothetical protein